MASTLFIPSELKVGFTERTDTFTGQLGYVIYKDAKGKLRKEQSWNSWRNKNIEPLDIKNVPTSGFMINKGVQRDNYWRNSGRSMMRIWHPDNFEFEVSISNFVEILTHSDLSKREIAEKCVFAWDGTELVLLPVNTQDYIDAQAYTATQSMKVTNASLKVGATYQVKSDNSLVVYLGKRDRIVSSNVYYDFDTKTIMVGKSPGTRVAAVGDQYDAKPKPMHTFLSADSSRSYVDPMYRDATFLSQCINDGMHADYATLVDRQQGHESGSLPTGLVAFNYDNEEDYYSHIYRCIVQLDENVVAEFRINISRDYSNGYTPDAKHKATVYEPQIHWFDPATRQLLRNVSYNRYYWTGAEQSFNHPIYKPTDDALVAIQKEIQQLIMEEGLTRPTDEPAPVGSSHYRNSPEYITDQAKERVLAAYAKRGWKTAMGLKRENGTIWKCH